MIWSWLLAKWNELRASKYFWYVVVAVVALAAGFAAGHRIYPTTTTEYRSVEDASTMLKLNEALTLQQKLQEQLDSAEKTIKDLKVRRKEIIRVVIAKDGTKTIDTERTTDIDRRTDTTKTSADTKTVDTNAKLTTVAESDTKVRTDTKQTTVVQPKDNYLIGISAGVGLNGVGAPGLEFKYRVFDFGKASLWTGAEVMTGPPFEIKEAQFRLSAGVSF